MSNLATLARENRIHKKKKQFLDGENLPSSDDDITVELDRLTTKLHTIQNQLDNTAHPFLIDSLIFEMKSLHIRHAYFLALSKEAWLAHQETN